MCFRYRQLEAEDGTALRVRFRRNPAVMRGYNGPADRQAMKPEVAVLALHNRHRRVFRETILGAPGDEHQCSLSLITVNRGIMTHAAPSAANKAKPTATSRTGGQEPRP